MSSDLRSKRRLIRNCCVWTFIFVVAMIILPLTAGDEKEGTILHIGLNFTNNTGEQFFMIPKTTPSFSEPEILILFGSALIGMDGFARRGLLRK